MIALNFLFLIMALAVVVKAADYFLKSAETIGLRLKLPAFILGVILIGFGTSLPELATSISSIINGTNNVTIANIIGSNMANILLILGISTVFLGAIKFKKNLINLDLPYLLAVSILFAILIIDGNLSRLDGMILIIGFLIYLLYNLTQRSGTVSEKSIWGSFQSLFQQSKKDDQQITLINDQQAKTVVENKLMNKMSMTIIILVVSIAALSLASRFAISNMLTIAQTFDFQVEIITFVTIALGTSLPELLVSFKALKQNKGDLVLGNIIGSSVFNILLVGGVGSLISVQTIGSLDVEFSPLLIWSIIGLLISALIMLINGITKKIHAWEGVMFILIYAVLISKIMGLN